MKGDDGFSVVSYKRKRRKPLKQSISPFLPNITKDPTETLQNFHETIKDIQNELLQSDFITHFKEILNIVLNEWDLPHIMTDEVNDSRDSSNCLDIFPDMIREIQDVDQGSDSENSPNCLDKSLVKNMQNVDQDRISRNSSNCLFSSLVTKKEMEGIDIVCYGLGQFLSCLIARYQLGFLLALKYILKSNHVYIYDPQFSSLEVNFLKELKLNVIDFNEEAKRTVKRKSVCFMPHCDLPLYNNLLWANWSIEGLSNLILIGNSFHGYEMNDARSCLKEKAKYVYLANRFITEIKISNVFRFNDVFNDLSIHYLKSSSLSLVDSFVWADLEEPVYTDEDEIIKCA